jgi:hypothetical protein
VKVTLGTFARSGIEEFLGGDIATGARAALLHYSQRLGSEMRPVSYPRFARDTELGSGTVYDITLDPDVQRSLEREVKRQGASLEQLTAHAVLVYLADLDRSLGEELEPESFQLL